MDLRGIIKLLMTTRSMNINDHLRLIEKTLNSDPELLVKFLENRESYQNVFGLKLKLIFGEKGTKFEIVSYRSDSTRDVQLVLPIPLLIQLVPRGLDVNIFNSYGNTALHVAASMGFVDKWKRLIAAGADPNIRAQGVDGQKTPLELASQHSMFEGVLLREDLEKL